MIKPFIWFNVKVIYKTETVKKRIDKAEIKGKEERLTQPDKIAIIYSQNTESQEYFDYIEYLQANDYVKKEIEELELEEVQGVKGLRALRISINTDSKNPGNYLNNESIQKAVKNMSVNWSRDVRRETLDVRR